MKLIDETIEMLSDATQPLANAFFKAQVIAHKLQNKEFAKWVKDEVQGYEDRASVPKYRTSLLTAYGNVENGYTRYSNIKLPVGDIPEDIKDKFFVTRHMQSIAVIEGFAKNPDQLVINIDHRLNGLLGQNIEAPFYITSSWGKPPAGCFSQILNEARSRLLDFLLNLNQVLPDAEGSDPKKLVSIEGLSEMFKGAVFGNGANISLAIGEGNQASHNSSTVTVNDIQSLHRELSKNKVSDADIAALDIAIEADSKNAGSGPKGLGPGVSGWLGSMIAKAGTPAWEVPAQVGAGLLTGALSKFFGL